MDCVTFPSDSLDFPLTQWILNCCDIWYDDVQEELSKYLIEYLAQHGSNWYDLYNDDNYLRLWSIISLRSSWCSLSFYFRLSPLASPFVFISTNFLGNNIHSRWHGGKISLHLIFLPSFESDVWVWRKSHVMWNHQIEINNGFFLPLECHGIFPPHPRRYRNIKAHMAHSPLNWWDSFLWGARVL